MKFQSKETYGASGQNWDIPLSGSEGAVFRLEFNKCYYATPASPDRKLKLFVNDITDETDYRQGRTWWYGASSSTAEIKPDNGQMPYFALWVYQKNGFVIVSKEYGFRQKWIDSYALPIVGDLTKVTLNLPNNATLPGDASCLIFKREEVVE